MNTETGRKYPRTRPWRPLLLMATGAAAYSNSFGGVFLLDDELTLGSFVVRDPLLGWAHYFAFQMPRPVALATFAANYAAGGMHPWGYHLVNFVVHLTAALVLYALVGRTLRLPTLPERYQSSAANIAFAAAAVWVVHPLTTQAVTYVVQRMESLMALWYLTALYVVNRAATAGDRPARRAWLAASVIAAWLAVGTKEVGVTLPVVALMYDRCYLAGSWAAAVSARGKVYLAMAAGWVFLAHLMPNVSTTLSVEGFGGGSATALTWLDYARSQPGVILHYLRLAVWPDPLCFDARWPVARSPDEYVPQTAAVVGLLALTGFALWRWPRVGFLPAAVFIILSPTSSVVAVRDLMYEHRMYLPLAAVVVLGVLAADAVLVFVPRRRVVGALLLLLVVVEYGTMTYRRNELYRDPVAMWADVVVQRPGSPRAQYWLGRSLVESGRFGEAVGPLGIVTRFDSFADPENALDLAHQADAHYMLGLALAGSGDDEAAVPEFRASCAFNPRLFKYARSLDAALRRLGRPESVPFLDSPLP